MCFHFTGNSFISTFLDFKSRTKDSKEVSSNLSQNTISDGTSGFWQKQSHIYEMPFYYIDYTLAQICAFQFWIRMKEDKESAWKDYLKLCKAGGSMSFLDLVKLANIRSPFDPKVFEEVANKINDWLSEKSI